MTALPDMRSLQIHCIGDLWVQSGYTLGPRTISDFELVFFPEGTGTVYTARGKPSALAEPCILVTRPGEEHSYRFDSESNVRHMFIHFESMSLRNREVGYESLFEGDSVYPADQFPLVPGLLKKMLWIANRQPPHWQRKLLAFMQTILEELASPDAYALQAAELLPIPVQQAIEFMSRDLSKAISIDDIASRSGWSHGHFTRMFTDCTGMSPKRFLLELRLRRAEEWMLRGKGTIKQISFQVGFSDEHHFSKMYKKIRGITPSEYIKRSNAPLFRHTAEPLAMGTSVHYPANRLVIVQETYIK
ncbi:AraC family transcriptional regulator [Paenibacillus glycanilyticus]|uniref:AraC family transcriptional regulator n=1 Tax=Paenibacillus glycanilyticus TaxID=126569 RepID=UPI002040AEBB|nr:AraC family transcriptional regulator [Paenibacillus glycanilyticus]MCM3627580.1 AraC family transcriptional regulator [Paenibacillus glycanilyticus]